ncbi:MAG: protein kinase domain-containing protein [Blastocatellia bacterium]
MIGRIIGNYQIISELARGGMGAVYRGQHLHLPREVVVKSILLAPFSPSAQIHLKARFRREAYIQSQLDHPNIVRVYEFFTAEDNYFLVMEYVPGMSLGDLLARQGVPTPAQAIYLCKQALSALDYAHNFNYVDESEIRHTGVIHRDIKPANLLLDMKGRLKIADFGIAKVLGEKGPSSPSSPSGPSGPSGLTQTGFHPGTIEYMSPEQIRGIGIDRRSDLYSLGVTFYEMLCGRLPFERSSTGADWEIRKGHIELEPLSVLERRPDLPPALAAIAMRALRKNPNERCQSAAEMLEALRNYEQQQAGNGTARVANGKTVPLIVAANPDHDTARPARPSQASIENATTIALEAANRAPVSSATTFINLSRNAPPHSQPRPVSPSLFSAKGPQAPGGKWKLAVAGFMLAFVSTLVYLFSQETGKTEPTAVASKIEAATSTPGAAAKNASKSRPAPQSGSVTDEITAFKQARVFEQQEHYGDAIKIFEDYLLRNPKASDTGAIMLRLGQLKQVQANLVSAEAAMNAAKYQLAARQYGESLRLQPGSQRAKEGLSQALAKVPDLPPWAMARSSRPQRRIQKPDGNTDLPRPPIDPDTPPLPPPPFTRRRVLGELSKPAPPLPETEPNPESKLEPKPESKPEPKPQEKPEVKP